MTTSVDLAAAFGRFTEQWQPHTIARLNDYDVRIAKVAGEFAWHTHPETDEVFLVVDGTLTIQLRDGDVTGDAAQRTHRGADHQLTRRRPSSARSSMVRSGQPCTRSIRSSRNASRPQPAPASAPAIAATVSVSPPAPMAASIMRR